ncbi:MAG TPA: hypothetical protein P5204_10600 [Kiritimatiellia bacterium]|nr:hypothetical protein [Kiritimatiellia bacterium]
MSEETNHIDGDKHAVPSNPLLGGFVPAFFPDCSWCVLSPWIATLDGKPYRLHCADNLTEEEARHIAYQLERYAHPKEEAMAYANAHTPNPTADRRATEQEKAHE